MKNKRAVVLLSGGLDSAVTLYLAKQQGFDCLCVSFDYGQRHAKETACAKRIAKAANCAFSRIKLDFFAKGSALLDRSVSLTRRLRAKGSSIPVTYVPARNIIFLSCALSLAESWGAQAVFIGAHDQDYSGYPDCRPEFFAAFQKAADLGTKSGCEGKGVKIHSPLLGKSKKQIVQLGVALGVPFKFTWSCYRGAGRPCGRCESCVFRAKGFAQAGASDPLIKDLTSDRR